MRQTLLITLLCLLPTVTYAGPGDSNAESGNFDYYAFEQSWSPEYCHGNNKARNSKQCRNIDGSWRSWNLTVHGLWPNYDRGNRKRPKGKLWPQYCKDSPACPNGSACDLKRGGLPAGLVQQYDRYTPSRKLQNHEWRKHGTCSGLSQAAYIRETLKTAAQLPTADVISLAAGNSSGADYQALIKAYGGPQQVGIRCRRKGGHQYLSAVFTCWKREADGKVGARMACPKATLKSKKCKKDQPVLVR